MLLRVGTIPTKWMKLRVIIMAICCCVRTVGRPCTVLSAEVYTNKIFLRAIIAIEVEGMIDDDTWVEASKSRYMH